MFDLINGGVPVGKVCAVEEEEVVPLLQTLLCWEATGAESIMQTNTQQFSLSGMFTHFYMCFSTDL